MNSKLRVDGVEVAHPLFFQVEGGGSIPTSTLQLTFDRCSQTTMTDLNLKWHSRLPQFKTACKCPIYYSAEFDGLIYAVAAWSHPVARLLPQDWMELRRFAISPTAPKNTATRMLGWMVRDIRSRFPTCTKVISYQDMDVHSGGIYKGAGWKKGSIGERIDENATYNNWLTRPGRRNLSLAPKTRWEKDLTNEPET